MATPTEHAFLSASSAHRWLTCTASPHFEEQFPAGSSIYAEEGRLAHSFCEIYAQREFQPDVMTVRKFNARVKKMKEDKLFDDEMIKCAEAYVEYLKEKSMMYPAMPHVAQEVRVDFSRYVPEGFGTCDCIMIGGDTLHITDYKHGKGVEVSAINNPQMRYYALGALELYSALFDIKYVSMAIFQPRITTDVSEDRLTVEELRAWGESNIPIAQIAFSGNGAEFKPDPHACKFCRGKAKCKARANQNTAFEEFKGCAIAGKAAPELQELSESAKTAIGLPNMLSDAEIGDLLVRAKSLVDWYSDLQEYATSALLEGKEIPGWKIVEGKSNRAFRDVDAVIENFKNAGYDEALLYERKPLTLTNFEKLCGKKEFGEIVGDLVYKPQGKPTLAPITDKRPAFNSAVSDFAGVK